MPYKAISALRRRVIENMTVRGLAARTQTGYFRVIPVLLGRKRLDTTARTSLRAVKSPLGHLSPGRLPPD